MATKKTTTRKKPSQSAKTKAALKQTAKTAPKKAAVKAKGGDRGARAKKTNGKLSALDAAAKVLGETKRPMTSKQLVEAMAKKGYWKSPGGRTPHATIYAAMHREIQNKGKDARFKKAELGKFAANV